jgi:hypothetical protein
MSPQRAAGPSTEVGLRTRFATSFLGRNELWQPANDPKPGDKLACDAIDIVIVPRARDLGSFTVRRALPSKQRQMIGPFIFFDQMGPAEFL